MILQRDRCALCKPSVGYLRADSPGLVLVAGAIDSALWAVLSLTRDLLMISRAVAVYHLSACPDGATNRLASSVDGPVSIRAPCAGRERPGSLGKCAREKFSPRSPDGATPLSTFIERCSRHGYDSGPSRSGQTIYEPSQSTPPARGATVGVHAVDSPHDWFQSTPPARGATTRAMRASVDSDVSIHAPRAGGDSASVHARASARRFNPRPPRGGRRRHRACCDRMLVFQSTPPARGATAIRPC